MLCIVVSDLNSLNSEIKDFNCLNPRTCHPMALFPASGWLIRNTEFVLRKTMASHSSGSFSFRGMNQLQKQASSHMNFDFLNISSSFMTFMKFSCLRACKHHASPKFRLCLTRNIPQHLAELKATSLLCQYIPKSTNWMLPKGAFSGA